MGALVFLIETGICSAQVAGTAGQGAPTANNITGYVRDAQSDEALPFANVIIVGTDFGAATNSDGYFVIVGAPADSCKLRVQYVGYAPREEIVNNTIGAGEPLVIKMVRTPIEMDGVTISAKVQMLEVSRDAGQVAISPVEIAILPNVGEVDIFRSLQLLPGISGVSDGSSGLYVRGGTPDQNLVLLDGMTIYHVDHFFGLFSAFNADAIKDIRVYKGGFPAEFGGRTSSVVNLTGKTGDVNKLHYGMGVNLLSGHGVIEIPLFDKGAFLLSARRSYTDIVRSPLYDKLFDFVSGQERSAGDGPASSADPNITMGSENPDFYFYDINSKVTLTPTERDILTLSIYSGRDNLGQFQALGGSDIEYRGGTSLFKDPNASLRTGQSTRWGNFGISGKWSRKLHDRFYSHLLVTHSTYFSKYDLNRAFSSASGIDSLNYFGSATTASMEDNELKETTVRLDNEWHLTNSHDLKLGLGFSGLNVHYFSTLNDTISLVNRETKASHGSFYFQDLWKLSSALEVTAGVRGMYYDQTSSYYLEPRASFVFSLSEKHKLKGAWGHYHQYVNRITNENVLEGSRDFWILADKDLEPGFAEHWILGWTYENGDYLFDMEGYYKDLESVVEYSRRASYSRDILAMNNMAATFRGTGFFQGTGYATGLDILAQKKVGRLTGWIGYSLGKVEYEFPDLNDGKSYPASHDRTHEVSIVSKLSIKNWDLSATWVYASGKAYTVPESQYYLDFKDGVRKSYIHISEKNSYRLPDYHRLDLSISRNFETESAKYVFGLSVFNLYDNTNIWYRQFNLNTVPVAVTDVNMLGFTPTVFFQIFSR
ncbi:MAG: TonB-dependent receptor [Gemmatimonadota bacterium]|nr:TonB-dependent receptor [Gemmatimonadota bacterium]